MSWSYDFQNSCGNMYDMKCIEEPSYTATYNNFTIDHIEIWSLSIGNAIENATNGTSKIMSQLKKHKLYKKHSPFNFFRQNLVFEVSKNMTLSQISKEILGKA